MITSAIWKCAWATVWIESKNQLLQRRIQWKHMHIIIAINVYLCTSHRCFCCCYHSHWCLFLPFATSIGHFKTKYIKNNQRRRSKMILNLKWKKKKKKEREKIPYDRSNDRHFCINCNNGDIVVVSAHPCYTDAFDLFATICFYAASDHSHIDILFYLFIYTHLMWNFLCHSIDSSYMCFDSLLLLFHSVCV